MKCVEASIVQAYLVEEISSFCALYFDSNIQTHLNRVHRNDDGGEVNVSTRLSIFKYLGRPLGSKKGRRDWLSHDDYRAAEIYVLLNCDEMIPFIE